MFVDVVKINVVSGNGGSGAGSFRREKFIPKGGPDGGDGGRGGHVYLEVDRNLSTLVDFHNNRIFKAENGAKGFGSRMHGKNGDDIFICVPVGTIVKDAASGAVIKDLIIHGEKFLLLSGGRGGRGNWHFRSSTRQAPHFYEKGEPGDAKEITLELKILADVGIIGMANGGKSTLLSKISNAHPKIADYPFTTLTPVLGLVKYSDNYSFVVADIPGLIEGASVGRGLGFDFLRHIERTRLYIHLVDATQGDAYKNYIMINNELKAYNKKLLNRPQVVVVNKSELLSSEEIKKITAAFKKKKIKVDFISAKQGDGVKELLNNVYNELKDLPPIEEEKSDLKVFRENDKLSVEKIDDNVYSLHGRRVEKFIAMMDFSTNETVQVFRRYLERQGINDFLKEHGVKTGDFVIIGEKDFIFEED